jgi:hypothetical protein
VLVLKSAKESIKPLNKRLRSIKFFDYILSVVFSRVVSFQVILTFGVWYNADITHMNCSFFVCFVLFFCFFVFFFSIWITLGFVYFCNFNFKYHKQSSSLKLCFISLMVFCSDFFHLPFSIIILRMQGPSVCGK